MSLRHMIKTFECKIGSHVQKLVLIKLADNANDDGKCWPSLQRIANECEISKRTAINAIKALEEKGFLFVHREKTSADMNKVNLYTLTLGGGESSSLGGESPALGGGESPAPRTSHSFETPKEPDNAQSNDSAFDKFWDMYGKKKDLKKCKAKWGKISNGDKDKIFKVLPKYVASTPDIQYRKMPHTWLNGECWNDEIEIATDYRNPTKTQDYTKGW